MSIRAEHRVRRMRATTTDRSRGRAARLATTTRKQERALKVAARA